MVNKFFTWGFVAFVIFFVAFRPDSASAVTRKIGLVLSSIANGFGEFLATISI